MDVVLGWLVLTSWVMGVYSARILVILPFPSRSHHIFSTALMKAMVRSGHEIFEYSPFPPATPITNHSHVEIHPNFEDRISLTRFDEYLMKTEIDKSFYGCKHRRIWNINYKICENTFEQPSVQKLLKSNDHFDLVMSESTFGQESLLVFGYRFSAPTIVIEVFFPFSILNRYAGNSLNIASVPDLTSAVADNQPMSFADRLLNFVSVSLSFMLYNFVHIPLHDEIVRKYFSGQKTPSVAKMIPNVSLYLTNSYPTVISYVRPYTHNIIPVGGITITSERAALPQDILQFMDSAKEGVIFFSLGSNVPIHLMQKEIIQIFINVFKNLPQKVIWKISKIDNTLSLPSNVMVKDWAPQIGILEEVVLRMRKRIKQSTKSKGDNAHPNCKLFITHGGLSTTHETIHAGVPTIGIPFVPDQPFNVKFMEHRGIGVKLNYESLSDQSLYAAVKTILNNPKYKKNAEELSRVYRDRPQSATASAVFWVEYVLRHGGAQHLRPVSASIPLYQQALLDILAVIFITFSLLCFIVYLTVTKLLGIVFGTRGHEDVKTSKEEN